jgi:hypothetical protein
MILVTSETEEFHKKECSFSDYLNLNQFNLLQQNSLVKLYDVTGKLITPEFTSCNINVMKKKSISSGNVILIYKIEL